MPKKNDMKDDIFDMLKKESSNASIAADGLLSDTKLWIDTGSYLFNALLSGSFFKGFPGNKIVAFAGPHSSGKSYLTMHVLKNFLNLNARNKIIYFDSEGAITTDIIQEIFKEGVENGLKRFEHLVIKSANEFKKLIYKLLNAIEKSKSENKYFIVLDSLGNLGLKEDKEQILKDKDTADMGRRAQYIKSIFRTITPQLSVLQQPFMVTTHTYDPMNMYQMKKLSGGSALEYSSNIVVELIPSKIKHENEIIGTNITARARKTRSTVQWKTVELALYYKTGLDKYYGLIDFALEVGYWKKNGHRIELKNKNCIFKKEINENPGKYFTKEVLKELDIYAGKVFKYGGEDINLTGKDDNINIDEVMEKLEME